MTPATVSVVPKPSTVEDDFAMVTVPADGGKPDPVPLCQGLPSVVSRYRVRLGAIEFSKSGETWFSPCVLKSQKGKAVATLSFDSTRPAFGFSIPMFLEFGSSYPTASVYHVQFFRVADGQMIGRYSGNTGSALDVACFFRTTWLVEDDFLVTALYERRSIVTCHPNWISTPLNRPTQRDVCVWDSGPTICNANGRVPRSLLRQATYQ